MKWMISPSVHPLYVGGIFAHHRIVGPTHKIEMGRLNRISCRTTAVRSHYIYVVIMNDFKPFNINIQTENKRNTMSMRRSHKRLRLIQIQPRYARKGRRKAPPDRPPGKKQLRPPRLPTRSYHFDTLPTTGATITPSEYTIYIHTRILG